MNISMQLYISFPTGYMIYLFRLSMHDDLHQYLCLCRAFAPVYLLCHGAYLLCCYVYVVLWSPCSLSWSLSVVFLSVDRAFKPVEGSYNARTFRPWVRPAVAVTPSVTQPLTFS